MINTFLYSVYGQGGGEKHKDDPKIAKYRNQWLDKLIVGQSVEAVVTLGRLADQAFQAWKLTPKGQASTVFQQAVTHPTFPESSSASGQTTKPKRWRRCSRIGTWAAGARAAHHATRRAASARALRHRARGCRPRADPGSRPPRGFAAVDAFAQGVGVTRRPTGSAALPTATEEQKDEAEARRSSSPFPPRNAPGTRPPDVGGRRADYAMVIDVSR